jgi:hypothetical protein
MEIELRSCSGPIACTRRRPAAGEITGYPDRPVAGAWLPLGHAQASHSHMTAVKRTFVFLALLALPGLCAPSSSLPRFSIENLWNYPLLPDFYETVNHRFFGLGASYPIHPRLDLQAGVAMSWPYLDLPYNDVSNTHGSTKAFSLGAEAEFFRYGAIRLFGSTGFGFAASRWHADDFSYEDPDEPEAYWKGSMSILDFRIAPGAEFFREEDGPDWSVAFSLPLFVPIWRNLESDGDERFFRDSYLQSAGIGMCLAIRLGI